MLLGRSPGVSRTRRNPPLRASCLSDFFEVGIYRVPNGLSPLALIRQRRHLHDANAIRRVVLHLPGPVHGNTAHAKLVAASSAPTSLVSVGVLLAGGKRRTAP